MAKKYCYLFTEGDATMRELLGGKGANLAEEESSSRFRPFRRPCLHARHDGHHP